MNYISAKLKNGKNIYNIESINKNKVILKKNNKKIITDIDKIEFVDSPKEKETNINIVLKNRDNISNEIMLRHLTEYEAIDILDNFVNEAVTLRLPFIRIIHGKHGGVLRNAVHEYLKTNDNIQSFRLGYYEEGSIGVTIAYIK